MTGPADSQPLAPRAGLSEPSRPASRSLRSGLAAIGAGAIARWRAIAQTLSLCIAVIWVAAKPGTWRRTTRSEFVRQCMYTGVSAIPVTLVVAGLIGVVMVLQALYWLQLFGQSGVVGQFLVLVLVREVAPLVTGLMLVGRSGTTSVVELLNLRLNGQLHVLDAQGVDPFTFLLVPRVVAFAACMFALNLFFVAAALLAGNVAANASGLASLGLLDFIDSVLRAMGPLEYVMLAVKPLAIGFVVGVITIMMPLGSPRSSASVYGALPRGFMRGVLAVLVVSGLITVVFR